MYKKFQLVKKYPGSPELGTVLCEEFNSHISMDKEKEYWQEMKEPEYEILSVRHKNNLLVKDIYTKEKSTTNDFNQYIQFEKSNHGFLEIYSIKRLSDGKIFTIGDNINSTSWNKDSQNDELEEISIASEDLVNRFPCYKFKVDEVILKSKYSWQTSLNNAIKAEEHTELTNKNQLDIQKIYGHIKQALTILDSLTK